MTHRAHHPSPVEGCFGCKVAGLGYDGGHLTRTTRDELGNDTREHRSGRVDVTIHAPAVQLKTAVQEVRS